MLLCQKLALDAAREGQQQVDSIRATLPSEKPLRGFFQPSGFLDMQPCSYIELAHWCDTAGWNVCLSVPKACTLFYIRSLSFLGALVPPGTSPSRVSIPLEGPYRKPRLLKGVAAGQVPAAWQALSVIPSSLSAP